MVCHDRLTEWDAPSRRSAPSIVDDRILTSCAVVCARMDGWWTLAAGNPPVTRASSRKEELADGLAVLTPKPVLMDRSPDPPAVGAPAVIPTGMASLSSALTIFIRSRRIDARG